MLSPKHTPAKSLHPLPVHTRYLTSRRHRQCTVFMTASTRVHIEQQLRPYSFIHERLEVPHVHHTCLYAAAFQVDASPRACGAQMWTWFLDKIYCNSQRACNAFHQPLVSKQLSLSTPKWTLSQHPQACVCSKMVVDFTHCTMLLVLCVYITSSCPSMLDTVFAPAYTRRLFK